MTKHNDMSARGNARRSPFRSIVAGLATLLLVVLVGSASAAPTEIVPGGPAIRLEVVAAGDTASAAFEGTAGQRVSLEISEVTVGTSTCCTTRVSILKPDGKTLASTTVGTNGGFLDAASLATTGTYTILIDPSSTNTGGVTLTLYDVPADVGGAIVVGGAPVAVDLATPGQNALLTFDGIAGQRVSAEATGVTIGTSSCCGAKLSIVKPDGKTLATTSFGTNGGFLDAASLPTTGTYTVAVDPTGTNTGGALITVHDVPADVTDTIAPGGPAVTVTTSLPGQNARVTFAGTAGQRVSLEVSDSCCTTRVTIVRPDGRTLASTTAGAAGAFVDATSLPATGTYTILVDPQGSGTGSVTLRLYEVPADATGTISPGGSDVTVATSVPGQNARVTFDGVTGQRVSLRIGPTCCATRISILKPSGSTLAGPVSASASGGFVDATSLPTTGTYTIVVDPQGAATGSITLTLYLVPADVTGAIIPGGAAVTVTTSVPGQNVRLTFDGTAGQRVSLRIGPSCCSASITILRPSGSTVASTTAGVSGGFLDATTLPVSGTYTILVDPQAAATGSITLTLYVVPADVTSAIVPGGAAVTVTTSVPGQNARLTFAGTTGQRVSLEITGSCCTASVSLLKPDGSVLSSLTTFGATAFLDTQRLPTTGTYTFVFDPQGSGTGSATFRLHDVPPDVSGTLLPGTPLSVTMGTPGQNARLVFDAIAGQRVTVEFSNVTIGSSLSGTRVSLLRPDSSSLAGPTTLGTSGGSLGPVSLSVAGTYAVVVDPQGANTGSMTVTLHDVPADVTASIVPGGPALTVTTVAPGQDARVTFAGAVGQRVSLELSSVTIGTSTCCSTKISLLEPGGATVVAPVSVGTSGGFVDAAVLPVDGTYTILVDPQGTATGSATLTLNDVPPDATAAATPGGGPVAVTTTTPGQNAAVTFTGAVGQRVSIKVGPTCCIAQFTLLSPGGTALFGPSSFGTGGGFIDTEVLLGSGTYTLFVNPVGAVTGSVSVTVYDVPADATGTITAGSSLTLGTSVPGQNASASFSGTADTGIKLTVGPFNCCSTKVSILNPDGTTLVPPTSFPPDGGALLVRLAVSGTYTILVDPQGSATGSVHLALELDTTAPAAPTLMLAESAPDSHVVGASFYYRPSGAGGSFVITATSSDGGTGLQKMRFPGLASGFSPTSPVDDTLSPYTQTYAWSSGAGYENAANLVTAYDRVGNTASTAFGVYADAAAPTTSDNTGAIGPGWKNTTQFVALSPSDGTGAGSAVTYYTADGSTPTTSSPQGTTATLSTDGAYTVKYFSVDNVGNVETVRIAGTQIRIDKTNPSSAVLDPLPATIKNGQVLTGSGTDALSGVASIAYYYCAGASCAPSVLIGSSSSGPSYPITWSSLPADGTYQLVARVIDAAGNTLDSAKRTVVVDNTAPNTTITSGPANPTNQTSATFSFSSTEAGSTFECRLDGGAFASCSSPKGYSGLAAGTHTFEVRATDPVGNTDASPASSTWTIDLSPPDTSITSAPTSPTNSTSATFGLTSTETGSTFQCSLDGGAFASCSSPKTYSGLTEGVHTVEVRATDPAGNTDATPASHTWTVDTSAPETTITSAPPSPTNQASATFTFASEPGATFECRLDGGAFGSCTTPRTYAGLAEGAHTFAVRAVDTAGNQDPTPATWSWTVDTIAPNTTITSAPASPTNQTTASFAFSSSEAGSTFECSLDGGTWATCTSAKTYAGLAEGTHTFGVRATDTAGNLDATPATHAWTVDTSAPETTITTAPASPTNQASATFTFASEPGASFECSQDGAAFASCSSPRGYSGLAAGTHTFEVRAIDVAGNRDATPASWTWTVDTSAPDTIIVSAPNDPTNQTDATFAFASEPGASFECSLDGGGFGSCFSPRSYSGLVAGTHTFEVRATDAAGNSDSTPAVHTWTIDLVAPDTIISSSPADPTNQTTAAFTFAANEAGSSFECSLDGGAFASCSSPKSYSALAEGSHTFGVKASDPAGNGDPSPASRSWTVDLTAPAPPVIESPADGSTNTTGTVTLSGTAEPGSRIEVVEGSTSQGLTTTSAGGTWARTLAGISDGSHTYTATARDAAGNTSPASSGRTVVVDTSPPNTTITAGPIGATRFTNASFAFTADEPGSTFECALDGGAFVACTSPKSYTGLAEGSHTFEARAVDPAGNADLTPANRTWTVDLTPPAPPVIASPTDGSTNTTGTVAFSGTAEPGSVVEIFDGGTSKAFVTVSSSGTWTRTLTSVPDGSHTYTATARDAASNTSAASGPVTVVVDKTAPDTTITNGPADPASETDATFAFSADEPGSTFECSLDGAVFGACSSPNTYTGLAAGAHAFEVRAIDPAGNTDATPAAWTWTVDTSAPDTIIVSAPNDPTSETDATFAFSADEPGSTFECSLDGAVFDACSSPNTYTGLAAGAHAFEVRAIDPAGNTDATPAAYSWTVA